MRIETEPALTETALYLPVKRFLEARGFLVKGEIGGCDVVGLAPGEPPVVVIGELKLAFNLELVLQGVDRAAAGDEIWLAAPLSARGRGREADPRFRNLCRRLGFGLLGIARGGDVEILVAPTAPLPRNDGRRRSRLVDEHRKRRGDPALGGSTRAPLMTAYRQQALACAAALSDGPKRRATSRWSRPTRPRSCRATSTPGSSGWSGAGMASPRPGVPRWSAGRRGRGRRPQTLELVTPHPDPSPSGGRGWGVCRPRSREARPPTSPPILETRRRSSAPCRTA